MGKWAGPGEAIFATRLTKGALRHGALFELGKTGPRFQDSYRTPRIGSNKFKNLST
jgi:hypothetical protein